MKPKLLSLVFVLIAFGLAFVALPEGKCEERAGKSEENIARIQKLLDEPLLDIKPFQQRMPLARFLAAVEGQLPAGKKISLRLDEDAFGKDLAKVAAAQVAGFPPAPNGTVSIDFVLSKALDQVTKKIEVDYGIRAKGVVITRPQLAAHLVVYQVRDIVEEKSLWSSELKKDAADTYQDLKPTDSPALLVRLLTNSVGMQPWETIQVLNGTQLGVLASPTRHQQIAELMKAMRRLADNAVVMNARLYEVDRAFFAKHVAPLFGRDKDSEQRAGVLRIDGPLFKKICRQQLLLESEDIKLHPRQQALFLSQHSVFRFSAGPLPGKEGRKLTGTGLAGVSFEVRLLISPDRRYLRLEIVQNVAQLVGIDKSKKLDLSTGKEVEIESPNLRKTSVTASVHIPDGAPILMPVDYRPPGKGKEDKVWLLLARPFIWIEDEVKIIRKGGGDLTPKSIWDSAPVKDEEPASRRGG